MFRKPLKKWRKRGYRNFNKCLRNEKIGGVYFSFDKKDTMFFNATRKRTIAKMPELSRFVKQYPCSVREKSKMGNPARHDETINKMN